MTSRTLTCSSDACTVGTPGTGMTGTRLIRPAPPSSRQPPALNRRLAAAPSPAPNTKVAPVRHMLPGQLLVTRCDDVTGMYLISNNCGLCGVTRRMRVYLSVCVQQRFVSTYFTHRDFFLKRAKYVQQSHKLCDCLPFFKHKSNAFQILFITHLFVDTPSISISLRPTVSVGK